MTMRSFATPLALAVATLVVASVEHSSGTTVGRHSSRHCPGTDEVVELVTLIHTDGESQRDSVGNPIWSFAYDGTVYALTHVQPGEPTICGGVIKVTVSYDPEANHVSRCTANLKGEITEGSAEICAEALEIALAYYGLN
jgi:hypothetical protein